MILKAFNRSTKDLNGKTVRPLHLFIATSNLIQCRRLKEKLPYSSRSFSCPFSSPGRQPWPYLTDAFCSAVAGGCEGCWRCPIVWILKRNLQPHRWEWTATIAILQRSTTVPNRSPWPPRRRTRKPGCAPSSREEGIKVKYQQRRWAPASLVVFWWLLVAAFTFCPCFLLYFSCRTWWSPSKAFCSHYSSNMFQKRGGGVQSVTLLSLKRQ